MAGSGKTIVLALKAAYLHTQYPELKIGVTYYTRALYQQYVNLITDFVQDMSGEKVDWDNLDIIHAWGSTSEHGVYSDMAQRLHFKAYNLTSAISRFGRTSPFKGCCDELLTIIGEDYKPKYDVMLIDEEEAVVICPVDPYVEDDYFKTIEALGNRAAESEANLVLMGIEPTYPSEKYGYIIPKSKENISEVSMFKEKPTAEVAEGYISQGALWNGGVFAFRLGYVLKRAHELIDFKNYDDLFAKYNTLKKISFDYAVVEHEPLIEVMRFSGTWKDLGTWNTLTEAMDSNNVGEALFNEKCENVHVVNELNMPVLCMGLKDVVVSASPEGILVSDKEQSSYIKPFVETFNKQVMFAEKSWGSFRVLDVEKESLTIKVTLNPGHKMNYHSHTNRDEVWTVVSGTGYTIIDGQKQIVRPGDVLRMPAGCKHTIVADTELQVIEVQMGKDISVHDKEKFELAL